MTDSKIFDFGEFKDLKEIRRSEKTYGTYLKSLPNSQLESEINHLLNEFSSDSYGKDFKSKGKLILKEISSRIQGPLKSKLEILTQDTIKKL